MRRFFVTALVLVLAIMPVLLWATGGSEAPGRGGASNLGAGLDSNNRFTTTRNITVGIWDRATAADPTPENNFWTNYIKEGMMRDHNVNVTYVPIPRWTEVEFLNNLMAAGTAPDIVSTFDYPTIRTYAEMGGILDMSPLLRDFRHLIPSVAELLTDDNLYWNRDPNTGRIWAIPGRLAINPGLNLFVRQDWMSALGIAPPANLQQFETMLRSFKTNAVRLVGAARANDIIPLMITDDVGWYARNLIASFIPHNITDRDFFIYGFGDPRAPTLPGTKEAFRVLNRWYNEGLLWDEFALGNATIADDLKRSGLVGAFMQNWDQPFRGGGMDINTTLMRVVSPQAQFVAVNPSPFINDAGFPRKLISSSIDRHIAFPATNTEPVASLLYLEWITRQENLEFLQFGVEGINHRRHPDGAWELLAAGAPHAINSVNNYDYTITINGIRRATPELTVRSVALSYPGISADSVMGAFYIPQSFDRAGRNYQVGAVDAEVGMGTALRQLTDVLYATALSASPADFDRIWDQGLAAYLNAGGQAIINERTTAWQRVYGNSASLP